MDRELVYPKKMDAIVPWWENHIIVSMLYPITICECHFIKTVVSALSSLCLLIIVILIINI